MRSKDWCCRAWVTPATSGSCRMRFTLAAVVVYSKVLSYLEGACDTVTQFHNIDTLARMGRTCFRPAVVPAVLATFKYRPAQHTVIDAFRYTGIKDS